MSLSNGAQYHVTKWWAPHRCRCNGVAVCHLGTFVHSVRCDYYQEVNLRTVGWGSIRSPVMLHELVHFSLSTAAVMASSFPVGTCSYKCCRHSLPVSWRSCCKVETL